MSGLPFQRSCQRTGAIRFTVVLLICFVGFISYGPLLHQVRFADPQALVWAQGRTRWKGLVGLPKFRYRKQVTWLHMHKFGGTFMTKMAGLQGEIFPPSNINADWLPDFCSTPPGQRILCAERTKDGSPSSNISWSAIERELDEGDFCWGAVVGTMLREPLSALQSVLSHDRFDKATILQTLRGCSEKAPAKHFMYQPPSKMFPRMPPCLPAWDTYQHFDNFATRTLAGAYSQAPCNITLSHLEAAKSQLQRMDVLTILEDMREHLPQLQDVFHWNITLVQSWRKVNRKSMKHVHNVSSAFTSEEMVFLRRINAIDLELYEFAMRLARNMTNKAKDNIAKRGDVLLPLGEQSRAQYKLSPYISQRVAMRLRAHT